MGGEGRVGSEGKTRGSEKQSSVWGCVKIQELVKFVWFWGKSFSMSESPIIHLLKETTFTLHTSEAVFASSSLLSSKTSLVLSNHYYPLLCMPRHALSPTSPMFILACSISLWHIIPSPAIYWALTGMEVAESRGQEVRERCVTDFQ